MWIPSSAADVETAAANAVVIETSQFDAKRELPSPGKNADIAIDVAAMANEGGVLLYGLGEDTKHRFTVLNPIPLDSAVQRIDQVLQTSLQPPLQRLDIRPLPSSPDPAIGYVLVVVDASSSAPHMVTVRGEARYYGRTPSGNALLTEAQVASLYRRRAQADQDALAVLESATRRVRFDQTPVVTRLDVVVWPAHADRSLLSRATDNQAPTVLAGLVDQARRSEVPPSSSSVLNADFVGSYNWRQSTTGWVASTIPANAQLISEVQMPRGTFGHRFQEIAVDYSGTLHMAWGGAGSYTRDGKIVVHSRAVAACVAQTLSLAGQLLKLGGYLGQTVSMVRLGPMLGAFDAEMYESMQFQIKYPSRATVYEQSVAHTARTLAERPLDIARDLITPLFRELTQSKIDPYPPA